MEELAVLLKSRQYAEIVAQAGQKKTVLSRLIALTFDLDPLVGARAIKAVGLVADRLAADNLEFVRTQLNRLHWMLNEESGSVGWHAPQAIAEIICSQPQRLADHLRLFVQLISRMQGTHPRLKAGVLWGIGRLGRFASAEVTGVRPSIGAALHDTDPQVRGMAVWCLGQTGQAGQLTGAPHLLADNAPVFLLADGELVLSTVGKLAQRARAGP